MATITPPTTKRRNIEPLFPFFSHSLFLIDLQLYYIHFKNKSKEIIGFFRNFFNNAIASKTLWRYQYSSFAAILTPSIRAYFIIFWHLTNKEFLHCGLWVIVGLSAI
jgi:hypothetical protein